MKPLRDASGKTIGYENDVSEYRKEISEGNHPPNTTPKSYLNRKPSNR